jgi:hypothetical protein
MLQIRDSDVEAIILRAYPGDRQAKTRENYLHRLRHLRDTVFDKKDLLQQPPPQPDRLQRILMQPDESYAVIRARYSNINTRKNVLTLILALFKHSPDLLQQAPGAPAALERWKTFHLRMDAFQVAHAKKHMPSQRELAQYTPFEEIEAKYAALQRAAATKLDPHATLEDSQTLVLLSVLISTPPKRADYGAMRVYHGREPIPPPHDENFLVLLLDSSMTTTYMVFNRYKTDAKYRRVDQVLPERAARDVRDSLRRHPREYLFVNRFGRPFATNDAFSKFVRRIFLKLFGRGTGVTMLRHIFITEKVSFDELDDDELEGVARQMMHSTDLQRRYNWNKKAVCRALTTVCSNAAANASAAAIK